MLTILLVAVACAATAISGSSGGFRGGHVTVKLLPGNATHVTAAVSIMSAWNLASR